MSQRFKCFIAGTDTEVGKTFVGCALLHHARQLGLSTLALKPVAAGCEETAEGPRNDDALALMQQATVELPYQQVNPITVMPPVAPHLGLQREGRRVTVSQLSGVCQGALMTPAEFKLVEGAGGWRVPLNDRETLADLAKALQLPVILVVGMRLGCINHALLTAEAIVRDGLPLAGWVANAIDPEMAEFEANLDTLKHRLAAPCLGVIPYQQDGSIASASQCLDLNPLLNGVTKS